MFQSPVHFGPLVWTMPAVVVATATAPQMIRGGEYHPAIGIEIKITGAAGPGRGAGRLALKRIHARATKAGAVAEFRRNSHQQCVRDARGFAPTRTLVCRCHAKPAVVRLAAQRALRRIPHRRFSRGHTLNCRRKEIPCQRRRCPHRFCFP